MALVQVRRGRPHKFSRPARTVTLTLPDDVIEALGQVDADLSRAIVRLAMPLRNRPASPQAEIAAFGTRAVIIVPPSQVLAAMAGVELVPLADGRALIALDERTSLSAFELSVRDTLDRPDLEARERSLLTALADILRQARQDARLTVRQILVVRARSSRARSRGVPGTP
jgi:hypothetical protein